MTAPRAGRVAARLRGQARRLADRVQRPTVSVVVGVRGPAAHLAEALASVRAATGVAEVLVALDPEDAHARGAVAALPAGERQDLVVVESTAPDPRLAAADRAGGTHLFLVDADDLLPRDALAVLRRSVAASGSDVATGDRGARAPARGLFPVAGPTPRPGTGVDPRQRPALLHGIAATGHLVATPAWRRTAALGARTADGVLAALLCAGSTDVLADRVLQQPDRQAGLAVERQDRFRAGAVARRVTTWRDVAAALSDQARDVWLLDLLSTALPAAAEDAVVAEPDVLGLLRSVAHDLTAGRREDLLAQVPLAARMVVAALLGRDREGLALVVDHVADHPHGFRPAGDGAVAGPEGVDLPPGTLAVRPADRVLRSRIDATRSDGGVVLTGAAFVTYDDALPEVEVLDAAGRPVATAPERVVDPGLEEWAARAFERRADAGWRARVGPVSGAGEGWTVVVRVAGHERRHRVAPPAAPAADLLVTGARVEGEDLVLRTTSAQPAELRLVGPMVTVPPTAEPGAAVPAGDGEVRVPLRADEWGEPSLLPAGRYDVHVASGGGTPLTATVTGPVEAPAARLRVDLLADGRSLAARVGAPLDPCTRSALGQRSLLDRPAGALDRRTVLVESFHGRSTGDSPGAVARELLDRGVPGLDVAVVVDDPSLVVPDGARAVVRRSPEWFTAMRTAGAYVANAAAPYWFEKPAGQLHVQTWHGTPLKRIGEDRGPGDFSTWRHRRRVAAQAARWDAMVSAGGHVPDVYRTAFGYTGEVLEVGYPRNDVLLSGAAGARRAAVRRRLRLAEEDRVVLYAPTWREHVGVRDGKPLHLDAEVLLAALPGTVVLVRGHYSSVRDRDVFAGHPRIRDLTRYPDVADLFLAADALVTDYSSVMFDFALTDRPQVLLVPDLEQYRDVERGFYFDIEQQRPGPLVRSTAEVVDVLAGPDRDAPLRAAFREAFCAHERGQASARVADLVLERLGR